MKHIHFDHKVDWLMLAVLFFAVSFYCISFYDWFELEKGQTRFFFMLGGLLNALVLSKVFWYKYYVRWNSKAITLKFNSFTGHTIPFSNIERFEFSDSDLIITKLRSKKKITVSTAGIVKEDLQKLENILQNHTKIRRT